jgi:hypothetical protein
VSNKSSGTEGLKVIEAAQIPGKELKQEALKNRDSSEFTTGCGGWRQQLVLFPLAATFGLALEYEAWELRNEANPQSQGTQISRFRDRTKSGQGRSEREMIVTSFVKSDKYFHHSSRVNGCEWMCLDRQGEKAGLCFNKGWDMTIGSRSPGPLHSPQENEKTRKKQGDILA